jgi:hypothetical protein
MGESEAQTTLVEVLSGASADAGSIPAASTFGSTKQVVGVFGRNDSRFRVALPPRERLHIALKVAEVTVPIDAGSGRQVRASGIRPGQSMTSTLPLHAEARRSREA